MQLGAGAVRGGCSHFDEIEPGNNSAGKETARCFRATVVSQLLLLTMVCESCRRRLLTGRGWLVVSVPFYEYYILSSVKQKVHPCVYN